MCNLYNKILEIKIYLLVKFDCIFFIMIDICFFRFIFFEEVIIDRILGNSLCIELFWYGKF